MKLELKHLSPYLPYGLKVKILNYKCDYVGIEYSEANGFYLIGDDFFITYNGGSTGKSISDFKPILRPLSDFNTKWMNAEQMSEWMAIKNDSAFWFDSIEFNEYVNLLIRFSDHQSVSINFEVMPVLNFLHKHHFDIFGLIPAGLAISKNEIDNQ